MSVTPSSLRVGDVLRAVHRHKHGGWRRTVWIEEGDEGAFLRATDEPTLLVALFGGQEALVHAASVIEPMPLLAESTMNTLVPQRLLFSERAPEAPYLEMGMLEPFETGYAAGYHLPKEEEAEAEKHSKGRIPTPFSRGFVAGLHDAREGRARHPNCYSAYNDMVRSRLAFTREFWNAVRGSLVECSMAMAEGFSGVWTSAVPGPRDGEVRTTVERTGEDTHECTTVCTTFDLTFRRPHFEEWVASRYEIPVCNFLANWVSAVAAKDWPLTYEWAATTQQAEAVARADQLPDD